VPDWLRSGWRFVRRVRKSLSMSQFHEASDENARRLRYQARRPSASDSPVPDQRRAPRPLNHHRSGVHCRSFLRPPLTPPIMIGDARMTGAIWSLDRQFLRAAETKFRLCRISDRPTAHRRAQFRNGPEGLHAHHYTALRQPKKRFIHEGHEGTRRNRRIGFVCFVTR